jgi:hypothetical protein
MAVALFIVQCRRQSRQRKSPLPPDQAFSLAIASSLKNNAEKLTRKRGDNRAASVGVLTLLDAARTLLDVTRSPQN